MNRNWAKTSTSRLIPKKQNQVKILEIRWISNWAGRMRDLQVISIGLQFNREFGLFIRVWIKRIKREPPVLELGQICDFCSWISKTNFWIHSWWSFDLSLVETCVPCVFCKTVLFPLPAVYRSTAGLLSQSLFQWFFLPLAIYLPKKTCGKI